MFVGLAVPIAAACGGSVLSTGASADPDSGTSGNSSASSSSGASSSSTASSSGSGWPTCPTQLPTEGTNCDFPNLLPNGNVGSCGYATPSSGPCAFNCYCQDGGWACHLQPEGCGIIDASATASDGGDGPAVTDEAGADGLGCCPPGFFCVGVPRCGLGGGPCSEGACPDGGTEAGDGATD
jgi:hypothetical protein